MKRLLLVEDDVAITRLLASFLRLLRADELAAFEVHTALNVAEAVARLKSQPFDLLLTDKNLPDGSGLQVATLMRQLYPAAAIVLMTAFPEPIDASEIDAWLSKPFKSLSAVRRTLLDAEQRRAHTLAHQAAERVRREAELKTHRAAS